MHQQNQLSLIQEELKIISNYSDLFAERLDYFIRKFYNNVLQTNSGTLFYYTNMEKQYSLFNSSLKMLFSLLDHPVEFINEIDSIILVHSHLQMKSEHIDDFADSLLSSIRDIYSDYLAEEIIESYWKIIAFILNLFKEKCPIVNDGK